MAGYDYYDSSEDTKAVLERMKIYVDTAIKNGDRVYQDKPGQLVITIRLPKKDKGVAKN